MWGDFTFYTDVFKVPVVISFDVESDFAMTVFDIVADCFYITDIVISFRTAYRDIWGDLVVDGKSKTIGHTHTLPRTPTHACVSLMACYRINTLFAHILTYGISPPHHHAEIARNYLKTWFVIDIAASLPLTWFDLGEAAKGNKLLRLMRLFKLFRMFRVKRYMRRLQELYVFAPSRVGGSVSGGCCGGEEIWVGFNTTQGCFCYTYHRNYYHPPIPLTYVYGNNIPPTPTNALPSTSIPHQTFRIMKSLVVLIIWQHVVACLYWVVAIQLEYGDAVVQAKPCMYMATTPQVDSRAAMLQEQSKIDVVKDAATIAGVAQPQLPVTNASNTSSYTCYTNECIFYGNCVGGDFALANPWVPHPSYATSGLATKYLQVRTAECEAVG